MQFILKSSNFRLNCKAVAKIAKLKAKDKSLGVLITNKKATPLLRTIGFQMPIELNESGYIGNITYQGQNVKLLGKP